MEDPFRWIPMADMALSTTRDSQRAIAEAAALRALDDGL